MLHVRDPASVEEMRARYRDVAMRLGLGPAVPVVKRIPPPVRDVIDVSRPVGPMQSIAALDAAIEDLKQRREAELKALGWQREYLISDLVRIVCAISGFNSNAIRSERRDGAVVRARQMTFWLARRFTTTSMPIIGRNIGGRDHTTVLHGARRVEQVIELLGTCPVEDTPQAWAEHLLSGVWPKTPGRG